MTCSAFLSDFFIFFMKDISSTKFNFVYLEQQVVNSIFAFLAVRPQPIASHHPRREHHPQGHRGTLCQQAGRLRRRQDLHPEVSGLPERRPDGRAHHGEGPLPLPAADQTAEGPSSGGSCPTATTSASSPPSPTTAAATTATSEFAQFRTRRTVSRTKFRRFVVVKKS
jgi:hypothetical protein